MSLQRDYEPIDVNLQRNGKRPPQIDEVRMCACGTQLSRYNVGEKCNPCKEAAARARAEIDGLPENLNNRKLFGRGRNVFEH